MAVGQGPIRVMLAKLGLDGHDRGVKVCFVPQAVQQRSQAYEPGAICFTERPQHQSRSERSPCQS